MNRRLQRMALATQAALELLAQHYPAGSDEAMLIRAAIFAARGHESERVMELLKGIDQRQAPARQGAAGMTTGRP